MFFRKKPFGGAFAIAAGLNQAVEFIQAMRFEPSDIDYLASLNLFEKGFLDFLSKFKVT